MKLNIKSVTAKFNRMSHGFVWSKFLKMLDWSAAHEGVPLAKAPPPFTSIIGILKYQQQYGISSHEAGLIDDKKPQSILVAEAEKSLSGLRYIVERRQQSKITFTENVFFVPQDATIDEVRSHEYILTPGRYVGIEEQADDGEPFDEKLTRLTGELAEMFSRRSHLEDEIRQRLGATGYEF